MRGRNERMGMERSRRKDCGAQRVAQSVTVCDRSERLTIKVCLIFTATSYCSLLPSNDQ